MDPNALPRPYESLHSVNLNGLPHDIKLKQICDAISRLLGIEAFESSKVPDLPSFEPVESAIQRWHLHPTVHINDTAEGIFMVGSQQPLNSDRALLAGLNPDETAAVQLICRNSYGDICIDAMVSGDLINFFYQTEVNRCVVAKIRCATVLREEEKAIPLIVVIDAREIVSDNQENQKLMADTELHGSVYVEE